MKQKKFNKKLGLNKSTVVNLNRQEMKAAQGGDDVTWQTLCCIPTGWSVCKCPTGDTLECVTVPHTDYTWCLTYYSECVC
jgi:hypothetical protein